MLSKEILFKYKEKYIFKKMLSKNVTYIKQKKSGDTIFKSDKELKSNFIRILLSITQEYITYKAKN